MELGSRVMLTDEALKMLPRYRGKAGTVVRIISKGKYADVKWEHLKKVQHFASALLEEVNRGP